MEIKKIHRDKRGDYWVRVGQHPSKHGDYWEFRYVRIRDGARIRLISERSTRCELRTKSHDMFFNVPDGTNVSRVNHVDKSADVAEAMGIWESLHARESHKILSGEICSGRRTP